MGKNIRNRDTGQRLFSNLAGFFLFQSLILEIPFQYYSIPLLFHYYTYYTLTSYPIYDLNITPLINKQHNIQVISVFALAASS